MTGTRQEEDSNISDLIRNNQVDILLFGSTRKMKPNHRFRLLEDTPRASKTTINIAGFHVYLYGVDELTPQQRKDTTVLFHVHGRTRSYKDSEAVAHQLLHDVRERRSPATMGGLVVATFDNRNHGARAIDTLSSQDWKASNPRHAQDMLSTIDGIVSDAQIVIKYLAAYVDGLFTPARFIASGVSLGGHVSWNLLAQEPRITDAVIVIGSPNLTDMMLDRLGGYKSPSEVPTDTKEWPKAIEKLYLDRDASLERISGKNILILNGAVDPLVPSRFTHAWMDKYAGNNKVTFIEQEETGHNLTYQMMDHTVNWLLQVLN
ncbi:hypothetical protein ASPZODRAFT_164322 [Penicilliopsis zonata CBS 506.65]|uniref:Peptidase S9 prolyl oligopeptidase catalytic domain-containing protein n=1 Tax=Penicilliopsis zonata CBS 506.65 TaxID=1073090 RepID=A0A1L9ST23_9EURO|nr:hypothetical protein ASPZODRAFT_164322 [Penicilliopsis zonata CBS 506.65]OJJ50358.1 hypothetical protein ASPZODRAFT_164322 [Penicilliopsis zonata CBS 506.65]